MFWNLFLQIISGILGIWLAAKIVPQVQFIGSFLNLVTAGAILGLLNFFVRPILKSVALPLRIITFNLFNLIINMFIIWLVDIIFLELIIKGLVPLFFTTIIIWVISFFLTKWLPSPRSLSPSPKI